MTAKQMQLFPDFRNVGLYWWQWHGRQMLTELRNDFRFPRKLHRVVYHLADAFKAPDEAAARRLAYDGYPDAQTLGLVCVGPAKQSRALTL